jgi:hypothetical protein
MMWRWPRFKHWPLVLVWQRNCCNGRLFLRQLLTCFSILTFMLALPGVAAGQEEDSGELVNFAYAAVIGTGLYQVGDRDIYIFRMPFSYTLKRKQSSDPGAKNNELRWILPVTLGLYNFSPDLENGLPSPSDIGTISFLPGLEATWRRPSGWQVRSYLQLGAGADLDRDEFSAIFTGGIKGHYDIVPMTGEQMGIRYGHGIQWAGYNPETGPDDSLGIASLGLEFRWLQPWRLQDRNTNLGLMIYGNYYFDGARFINVFDPDVTIKREVTVGFSIGGDPHFRLLGLNFERLGVGFKTGPNLRAITVFSSFPF